MAAGRIRKRMTKQGPKWQAIVDLAPDPVTRARRSRSAFCDTEREAKKALARLQVEVDAGRLAPRATLTVEEASERWIDQYARFKSPKTFEDYERQIRVYLLPHLGTMRVQDLKAAHVRTWVTTLRKAGKGTRTVEMALMRLCQVIDQCVADDIVPANVARAITVPKPNERATEHKTWSAEDAGRFLEAAEREGGYGPIWLISLATGMRRGELLGLRWVDVDWPHSTLRVRQAVGIVRGKVQIKTLKGKAATRNVLVDTTIMERLRTHRTAQNAYRLRLGEVWEEYDLLFPSAVGTPINPNNLYRAYKRLVAAAGVPHIRIHDQRHTHITWALEEGADLKAVSERAGHARTSTTTDIYQHVTSKLQADVVERITRKLPAPAATRAAR